jgi:hypothetical protein
MNGIIFLCGGDKTGKTSTLTNFFTPEERSKIGKTNFFQKTIGNKKICVVGTDSPQENHKIKFCKEDKVTDDIRKRLRICSKKANSQSYVLIVPISINQKGRGKEKPLNRECVLKPIESFKNEGFKVFSFCLWKKGADVEDKKTDLIDEIEALTLAHKKCETVKDDYGYVKSVELRKFIEEKVISEI